MVVVKMPIWSVTASVTVLMLAVLLKVNRE
jgi:hypothetical protein